MGGAWGRATGGFQTAPSGGGAGCDGLNGCNSAPRLQQGSTTATALERRPSESIRVRRQPGAPVSAARARDQVAAPRAGRGPASALGRDSPGSRQGGRGFLTSAGGRAGGRAGVRAGPGPGPRTAPPPHAANAAAIANAGAGGGREGGAGQGRRRGGGGGQDSRNRRIRGQDRRNSRNREMNSRNIAATGGRTTQQPQQGGRRNTSATGGRATATAATGVGQPQ
jgi:hypothetical protein